MQAACYGRAFCSAGAFPRKRLLEVCKLLRLLNALRQPEVGLPMTMAQLEALTAAAVLTRLVTAKRHLLALRIATTLDLAPEQVLRPPLLPGVRSLCAAAASLDALHDADPSSSLKPCWKGMRWHPLSLSEAEKRLEAVRPISLGAGADALGLWQNHGGKRHTRRSAEGWHRGETEGLARHPVHRYCHPRSGAGPEEPGCNAS